MQPDPAQLVVLMGVAVSLGRSSAQVLNALLDWRKMRRQAKLTLVSF